jgi:hypothetical protein
MLNALRNSPIARIEGFHQQRTNKSHATWRRLLLHSLYWILAAFCLIASFVAQSIGFLDNRPVRVILLVYYGLLIWLHFRLMLRTLSLSSSAITREKRNTERWEALLLTGISGRDIVMGKWWATVKSMWRAYGFLALLRTAAIVALVTIGDGVNPHRYLSYPNTQVTPLSIVLGIVAIVTLTLINLPYTAACGVMSAIEMKHGSGLMRALVARVAFTTLAALLPVLAWAHIVVWVLRLSYSSSYFPCCECCKTLQQPSCPTASLFPTVLC